MRAKEGGSGSFPGTPATMTSASSAPRHPKTNPHFPSTLFLSVSAGLSIRVSTVPEPRTLHDAAVNPPGLLQIFQSPPPLPRAVSPIRWSTVGVKHWQGKHTPSGEVDSRHPTMCLRLRTQRHCLLQSFNVAHAGSTSNPTRGSKQVAFNSFLAVLAQCIARFRRIGEGPGVTGWRAWRGHGLDGRYKGRNNVRKSS